jgi:hypothetical protein
VMGRLLPGLHSQMVGRSGHPELDV